MLVSHIITAYNEEKFVASSVASIMSSVTSPSETIFVDDLSDDGTLAEVAKADGVKVIKNKKRVGVSASRAEAYKHISKESSVVAYWDAHCWVLQPGSLDVLVNEAPKRNAILVPSFSFVKHDAKFKDGLPDPWPPKGLPINYGSGIVFEEKRFFWYLCVDRAKKDPWTPRTGFHAPGSFMSREVHDRLDGWTPLPGYWGSNDPVLSAKAFLMDIEILSHPDAHLFHFAKKFTSRNMPMAHECLNRVIGARMLFCDALFFDFWLPHFRLKYKARFDAGELDDVLEPGYRGAERAAIRANYVRKEPEFLKKFVKDPWSRYPSDPVFLETRKPLPDPGSKRIE